MSIHTTLQVQGMSCGHCVATVTNAVCALDGVTDVAVDLSTGEVEVTSETALDLAELSAVIDDAGYEVTS